MQRSTWNWETFFIVLPLEAQPQNIIEQHKFLQLTVNNKDNVNAHLIDDVCDGLLYKNTLKTFSPLNDCLNFSITFNCDGVPFIQILFTVHMAPIVHFKWTTSQSEIWPYC